MRSLALSLDALVQWISPALLATGDREEEGLAHVFSEAVRHSLLPQDTLFDVNDFLVFAEMEWSCKELPADDVEGCVRYLQDFAPELDPLNPRHRELIQLRMSKFFADPGRKYKQELARTEKELKLTRRTADKQL